MNDIMNMTLYVFSTKGISAGHEKKKFYLKVIGRERRPRTSRVGGNSGKRRNPNLTASQIETIMSAISQMVQAGKSSIPPRILDTATQKVYKSENGNSVPLDASSREYQNTRTRVLQFKHNQSGKGGAVSYLKDLMLNKNMFRSDAWTATMEKYY